jgi:myo-inositol-1(or 4)-monophosphatase
MRHSLLDVSSHDEDIERSALSLAEELARAAIDLARGGRAVVGRKAGAFDVVTAADIAIESHFRSRIAERFPDHAVLGEEQGLDVDGREWTWVVDPIDGTFNYATGLGGAASSIALMRAGETRVGAIADFGLGTVFSGRKGGGVTCSGGSLPRDIEAVATLGRARLLIDPGHQSPDPTVFRIIQSLAELATVVPRMSGSAAVSLAAIAFAGGCFVGSGLEVWDAAAGMLLVEERGGAVRWWRFAGNSSHHVLAGEPELVDAFEPVMPHFIRAWRGRRDASVTNTPADDELLGPSATILGRSEGE